MSTRARTRARTPQHLAPDIDAFRAQHLALSPRQIVTEFGTASVTVDQSESPLSWLARRQGRNGRPLIDPHQLQAGDRLRAEFTRAHLMPRTTSNWDNSVFAKGSRLDGVATDEMIAAQQNVHRALDAVGPEFAGLLLDVCCFLKRLEDIERERVWPARSAKVVLQLALTRLARHYGYGEAAKGAARAAVRTWRAEDAQFTTRGD